MARVSGFGALGSWRRGLATASPLCGCELEEVMGGTDHGPFLSDVAEAAEEELSKASCRLDVTEHRLDDLLAQAVSASVPGSAQLGGHGGDARSLAGTPFAGGIAGAVSGPARGEIGGDAALGEKGEVRLVAIAGIGGEFLGASPQVMPDRLDQRDEGAAVGSIGLNTLGEDDLMRAVDGNLGVVALNDAVGSLQDTAVGVREVALR